MTEQNPTKNPRMDIASRKPDLSQQHAIKVNVTREMCIRLHSHKLLHGIQISMIVQDALDVYFQQHRADNASTHTDL